MQTALKKFLLVINHDVLIPLTSNSSLKNKTHSHKPLSVHVYFFSVIYT